jgi:hypothetical protein
VSLKGFTEKLIYLDLEELVVFENWKREGNVISVREQRFTKDLEIMKRVFNHDYYKACAKQVSSPV